MSWKSLYESLESKKILVFNVKKEFFLNVKVHIRWPRVLEKTFLWLQKSKFSKIKDLNQKTKNMTTLAYPPGHTLRNWKPWKNNLKIVEIHFDIAW